MCVALMPCLHFSPTAIYKGCVDDSPGGLGPNQPEPVQCRMDSALVAKACEARVEVDAEVIGLFRDVIPDQAFGPGGELESARQRNGCIPDLQLGFQVALDPRPADYHPQPGRRPALPQPGQPDHPPAALPPQPRVDPTGQITRHLAELKVIGAGPSR